jgi:Phage capsid family
MSLAADIGKLRTAQDVSKGATDFTRLAVAIAKNDGKLAGLKAVVDRPKSLDGGLGPDLSNIIRHSSTHEISRHELRIKATQNPQSLAADTALAQYGTVSNGFISSLVNAGAFDGMLGSMTPLPLRLATVGAITTSVTAYQIFESTVKRVGQLAFSNQNFDPLKVVSMLVLSKELVYAAPAGTLQLIERELRKAVAKATDEVFLSTIGSGVSPITSAGSTGESLRADISNMLSQLTLGSDSRLFLVTNSTNCKRMAMLSDQHGVSAFPDLTPMGGEIQGIPVLLSDAVGVGLLYLIDASSIGANGGEMVFTEADQVSIHLDDAPTSPPTASSTYVSLWQMNLLALRVERQLIIERLRSNSVAAVSNSSNWGSGNSPP